MAPFTIEALTDTDAPDLARFYSTQTNEPAEFLLSRLRQLAANPSRRDDVPFAWGARTSDGTIVGAMLCIPHRVTIGSKQEHLLMSSGFYVDASIRGAGVQIFLKYRALDTRFVLYATTAHQPSARLWKAAGAQPLAKTDYEWLKPIGWAPIMEEMTVRRVGRAPGRLVRAGAPIIAMASRARSHKHRASLTTLSSYEDAANLPGSTAIQPIRDAAFLRWRYEGGSVYAFHDHQLNANGFIGVTRSSRGFRGQIRATAVADIWGTVPPSAFAAAMNSLVAAERDAADLIVLRCLSDEHEAVINLRGFRRRSFEGPIGWYLDHRRVLGDGPVLLPPSATEMV